jgi:two-component system, OmpR family, sensor histidine kinase KdpD
VRLSHHLDMRTTYERRLATGLLVSVASVAAITLAIYGLRELVPVVSTGVVYLLAVLLVAGGWGLWLGLATALLSAAAFNFFHIPPTGQFTIADGQNWVALAVFFVAAVVTSTLANAARARASDAERDRSEADLTAEMARLLLGGESLERSLHTVGQRIAQTFNLRSVAVEANWVASDERRRALPLVVDGSRVGTVVVPTEADGAVLRALEDRIVPALETLLAAARRRDELEAQVIETKALRRANVVKTTLLRSVSHDLRSPLTAIATAAGGLESGTISDEQRRELASVITEETARLERLIRNLLDLSRLQSGSAEPRTDWTALDELVAVAVASTAAPPGTFDLDLDPEIPLLRVDAAQIERALANVLENAASFAGDEPIMVRARANGPTVLLRITDHGPGIPREQLERIFEPFYRAHDGDQGSGLGLAIARGFLEANGGRIRAESLPGQGTSFVIQLRAPAEAPAGEPARG